MATVEIGDNLLKVLEIVMETHHTEIMEGINKIMATQAEFDIQVQALRDAVTAETEQVAAWIAANPNLDTSALTTMVTNIQNIFTPAVVEEEGETEETTP